MMPNRRQFLTTAVSASLAGPVACVVSAESLTQCLHAGDFRNSVFTPWAISSGAWEHCVGSAVSDQLQRVADLGWRHFYDPDLQKRTARERERLFADAQSRGVRLGTVRTSCLTGRWDGFPAWRRQMAHLAGVGRTWPVSGWSVELGPEFLQDLLASPRSLQTVRDECLHVGLELQSQQQTLELQLWDDGRLGPQRLATALEMLTPSRHAWKFVCDAYHTPRQLADVSQFVKQHAAHCGRLDVSDLATFVQQGGITPWLQAGFTGTVVVQQGPRDRTHHAETELLSALNRLRQGDVVAFV